MNAEAIALFVAGIIAPIVIQRLKGSALTGRWALWFAVAVSLALATVAQLLTGGIPGPEEVFAAAAAECVSL